MRKPYTNGPEEPSARALDISSLAGDALGCNAIANLFRILEDPRFVTREGRAAVSAALMRVGATRMGKVAAFYEIVDRAQAIVTGTPHQRRGL